MGFMDILVAPIQIVGWYWAILYLPISITAILLIRLKKKFIKSGQILGSLVLWLFGLLPLLFALIFVIAPGAEEKTISFIFSTCASLVEVSSMLLFVSGFIKYWRLGEAANPDDVKQTS